MQPHRNPPWGPTPPGHWQPPGAPHGSPLQPKKKSSAGLILGILVGAVVLLFGGCVLCVALLPKSSPAELKQRVDDRKTAIAKGVSRFQAIQKGFPTSFAEKVCPDERIPKTSLEARHYSVDYDFLEIFSNADLDVEHGVLKDYDYLTSGALRGLDPPGKISNYETYAAVEAANRFAEAEAGKVVIVIKAERRVLPKSGDGGTFASGVFDGWAVVTDYDTGAPLCMARVTAESSDEVSHRRRSLFGKSADNVLRDDFEKRIEKALDDGLGRISKKLSRAR